MNDDPAVKPIRFMVEMHSNVTFPARELRGKTNGPSAIERQIGRLRDNLQRLEGAREALLTSIKSDSIGNEIDERGSDYDWEEQSLRSQLSLLRLADQTAGTMESEVADNNLKIACLKDRNNWLVGKVSRLRSTTEQKRLTIAAALETIRVARAESITALERAREHRTHQQTKRLRELESKIDKLRARLGRVLEQPPPLHNGGRKDSDEHGEQGQAAGDLPTEQGE